MVTQAAGAELGAIQHDVVVRAANLLGLAIEQRQILFDRRHEGLMDIGELPVLVGLE